MVTRVEKEIGSTPRRRKETKTVTKSGKRSTTLQRFRSKSKTLENPADNDNDDFARSLVSPKLFLVRLNTLILNVNVATSFRDLRAVKRS